MPDKTKLITAVAEGSPAYLAGIKEGDLLLSLNGEAVQDVFGYRGQAAESRVTVKVLRENSKLKFAIEKDEDEDLGLEFGSGLMDCVRACENNCVFCFVAQNPPGVRSSLLFKDDDWRMSFLTGSYITAANMDSRDINRIIKYRLSPINISVHAAIPSVYEKLTGGGRVAWLFKCIGKLSRAGIELNFQVVLCKGINDREILVNTVDRLAEYMPQATSLSVVPVGLTKHRSGLYPLEPFSQKDAAGIIRTVEAFAEGFKENHGTSFVWAADELYVLSGLGFPPYEYYENFSQLSNGVGMAALFLREFEEELAKTEEAPGIKGTYYIITGTAAHSLMEGLAGKLREKFQGLELYVIAVKNDFFGEAVTVSGLIAGRDIVSALKGKTVTEGKVLIPENMLRDGEDVFLDDMTAGELEQAVSMPVFAVPVNGAEFVRVFAGHRQT